MFTLTPVSSVGASQRGYLYLIHPEGGLSSDRSSFEVQLHLPSQHNAKPGIEAASFKGPLRVSLQSSYLIHARHGYL